MSPVILTFFRTFNISNENSPHSSNAAFLFSIELHLDIHIMVLLSFLKCVSCSATDVFFTFYNASSLMYHQCLHSVVLARGQRAIVGNF